MQILISDSKKILRNLSDWIYVIQFKIDVAFLPNPFVFRSVFLPNLFWPAIYERGRAPPKNFKDVFQPTLQESWTDLIPRLHKWGFLLIFGKVFISFIFDAVLNEMFLDS